MKGTQHYTGRMFTPEFVKSVLTHVGGLVEWELDRIIDEYEDQESIDPKVVQAMHRLSWSLGYDRTFCKLLAIDYTELTKHGRTSYANKAMDISAMMLAERNSEGILPYYS